MAKQRRPRGCWIRVGDEEGKPLEWEALWDAEPIRIAGWEDLNLYIHKTGVTYGRWFEWKITEATTGRYVAAEYGRKATIAACRAWLEQRGHERVLQLIESAQIHCGTAPEWQEQEGGD